MADEEDDDAAEPAVELGDGDPVDGAPLARVASRLTWGMKHSDIVDREGETTIRTPEGPQELGHVLEAVDVPYFETRQEFTEAVRAVIKSGPVPTADE